MICRSTAYLFLPLTLLILLMMGFWGVEGIFASPSGRFNADLRKATYAATDCLEGNLVHDLSRVMPILATPFVNLQNAKISSLGGLLGEQVASRFSQHGYQVIDLKARQNNLLVQTTDGELALSPDLKSISESHDAQAVIAGTYAVSNDLGFVSIKIVRIADNSILTSYDFTIRMDDTLKKLAQTEITKPQQDTSSPEPNITDLAPSPRPSEPEPEENRPAASHQEAHTAPGPFESGAISLNPANPLAARVIQRRLAQLGFYRDSIDGVWKRHSRQALREFKEAHGFKYVLNWDMKTQKALFQGTGQ